MFKLISLSLLLTVNSAYAFYSDSCDDYLKNGFAFALNAGPVWTAAGNTQTLTLQPDIQKTYVADNFTKGLLGGELFLGYQFYFVPNIFAQFGFAYNFTSSVKLTGSIWEDADPDFDNFKYEYSAFMNNFAIKGKLLSQFPSGVSPYIGGSLGMRGYNHASKYSSTPYIVEEVPAPPFADGTESNVWTYSAEVGIQKALTEQIYAGIGYVYNNWGKVSLGTAPGQTTTSTITVDNFVTSGVRFNVTFIASN